MQNNNISKVYEEEEAILRSKFDFPSNLIKLVLGPAPVPLSNRIICILSVSCILRGGWTLAWAAGIKMMDICITHGDGDTGHVRVVNTEGREMLQFCRYCKIFVAYV